MNETNPQDNRVSFPGPLAVPAHSVVGGFARQKFHGVGFLRLIQIYLSFFFVTPAFAHDPSKSYLNLTLVSNQFNGQWDIPLRDLATVDSLNLATNGFVSYEKLHTNFSKIVDYAQTHLKVQVDGQPVRLLVTNTEPVLEDFSDGSYVELFFAGEQESNGVTNRIFPSPKKIEIEYQLFFDINSLHRGLLRLEAGDKVQSSIFTPERRTQIFTFAAPSAGRQFMVFLREGVWHIWTGYDHILFLLALLLPAVLQREGNHWRGVSAFRPAFMNIFKIVTAFTVAHSLTLSLATLEIVRLPSRLTESAIAASVVLAAANNIRPLIRERSWMVAFIFGLVHGFGFATALSDLGLAQGALALTLVGFNLGVETGQLAIVAMFLPVAFALRKSWWYQTALLRAGSVFIILIAGTWLAERIFDFKVLPF